MTSPADPQTATGVWLGRANNNSAPEASRLTGNRPLEKLATGTLTLLGAPTYSGGTIIDVPSSTSPLVTRSAARRRHLQRRNPAGQCAGRFGTQRDAERQGDA